MIIMISPAHEEIELHISSLLISKLYTCDSVAGAVSRHIRGDKKV
jgi:hypothetical protein